ncbi:MAG: metallophosphoesterase family protein, partial [Patescibacteria group bacterium]
MKIAMTADIHLKTRTETPKRWYALENILDQIISQQIDNLIIAGDLFDIDTRNYSEFDQLCNQEKHRQIAFHIIPGNHDSGVNPQSFASQNITVYDQPSTVTLGNKNVFFAPYVENKTMAEAFAENRALLKKPWILVGHGDYMSSAHNPNPLEPGIYMPLSKKALNQYQPAITLLGHIHKPLQTPEKVYYPGSPCGLDITETGRRKFLVLDLENLQTKQVHVDSKVLYFDENIVVYPLENEKEFWKEKVATLQEKWNLSETEKEKTVLRIEISGYSANRRELKKYFEETFQDFSFWKEEGIDISQVKSSQNQELLRISEQISSKINRLEL